MKQKTSKETQKQRKQEMIANIPILNIRVMTDEEWNRIAYKNFLARKSV